MILFATSVFEVSCSSFVKADAGHENPSRFSTFGQSEENLRRQGVALKLPVDGQWFGGDLRAPRLGGACFDCPCLAAMPGFYRVTLHRLALLHGQLHCVP